MLKRVWGKYIADEIRKSKAFVNLQGNEIEDTKRSRSIRYSTKGNIKKEWRARISCKRSWENGSQNKTWLIIA